MTAIHDLIPLRLADREQRWPTSIHVPDSGDVNLAYGLAYSIIDGARHDLSRQAAEPVSSEIQHPLAADALEVRAKNIARETVLATLPDFHRGCRPGQLRPERPHHRVIEG